MVFVLAAISLGGSLMAGCGGPAEPGKDERGVRETLSQFYMLMFEQQKYSMAAQYVAPSFHLRRLVLTEGNYRISGSWRETARRMLEDANDMPQTEEGPSMTLIERVSEKRRDQLPFSQWSIDRVRVTGDRATAITADGSCGLVKVKGRWLMEWVQA